MDKIGICIVGYGNFGKKLHGYLSKMDSCEVKYLYHPDPAKAAAYGPLGVSDLDVVWEDEAVDAFIIASPNDQHFKALGEILFGARHHVFVEKPMTSCYEEALILRQLVEISPKVFMVGHCHRREGVYRKAKEFLDEGRVGRVVSVDLNLSHGGAFTLLLNDWRASAARTDLGPLAMVGSHCIDTIHYLFGKVVSVYAKLSNLTGVTGSPDTSSAVLNLENGATVFLRNNYNVPSERHCFISGTEGAIYIERGRIWLRVGRDQNRVPSEKAEWAVPKTDPITEELREFLDAIRTGKKVETGYVGGLAVVKVLEACRQSAKENKPVRLS
jgi:predicted dehydrogenase